MGNSAAALIDNGEIVFAAEEERFSRIKNDGSFPIRSVNALLKQSGIGLADVELICVYWDRVEVAHRMFDTLRSLLKHPSRFQSKFSRVKNVLLWSNKNEVKEIQNQGSWRELFSVKKKLETEFGKFSAKIVFLNHHLCHIASAYDISGFEEALILSYDGGGESLSTLLVHKSGDNLDELLSEKWPNSLGHFYSIFTGLLGFKMLEDEYKLMGLASFGNPCYTELLKSNVLDIQEEGSYKLNTDLVDYHDALMGKFPRSLLDLFGPPRLQSEPITSHHENLASSVQAVFEQAVCGMVDYGLRKYPDTENLCIVGGCALNVVANGQVSRSTNIRSIYVPPAPNDAGCAIGSAILGYRGLSVGDLSIDAGNAYLGEEYSNADILNLLESLKLEFPREVGPNELAPLVANKLASGNVVAWYQGRSEFGPRALGNRSILADPRKANIQEIMNKKIKKRELFRPFAPSVKEECVKDYFDLIHKSPYMNIVARVKPGVEDLIPAVTHVDGTARVHTVSRSVNQKYWCLIDEFQKQTGIAVLLNTSFNIQEPIVNSPEEAINTFCRSDIDFLVMNNYIFDQVWRRSAIL